MLGEKLNEVLKNYITKDTAFTINDVAFSGTLELATKNNTYSIYKVNTVLLSIFTDVQYDLNIEDEYDRDRVSITKIRE